MSVGLPVYKLAEWQRIEIPGISFAPEDRRLLEELSTGDALRIDELRGGIRISAGACVGVVRFLHFEIQITPKLTGENMGLVELLDYAGGIRALRRFQSQLQLFTGDRNLLDLIALLFAEAVERILRHGLLADYCDREDDLPFMRGRLLVRKQILQRFGQVDRLECRFDEQLTDIPENQILAAALVACTRTVCDERILQRIRRLRSIFAAACDHKGVDLLMVRHGLVYHRLNRVYREPHHLAWLILDAIGVKDIYQEGFTPCFAFLLDMNRLFEAFVSKWVAHLLGDTNLELNVHPHDRSILWHAENNKPYATVIPDLLVEIPKSTRRLPIDAKYKLYDARSVDTSDLYQAFFYAFAFGEEVIARLPRALLLYPSSGAFTSQWRVQVRSLHGTIGGEIIVFGIHLPTAIKEARSDAIGALGHKLRTVLVETLATT